MSFKHFFRRTLQRTRSWALDKLTRKKGHVVVVSWSMSHNPVGRAFLFADFLKRDYHVRLVGPIFPKYGKRLWKPLLKYPLSSSFFFASDLPDFLHEAEAQAAMIKKADVVIICKSRLPSMLLGLLIAQRTGAKVILDLDEDERSFVAENESTDAKYEYMKPYSRNWTNYCAGLISRFDCITVSSSKLQDQLGGCIIPHVRDDAKLNRRLYDRAEVRKKFGYHSNQKIILFLGTPRAHKGILQLGEALVKLDNPNYRLCIIGKFHDHQLRDTILSEPYNRFVDVHGFQDFRKLPATMMLADLVCLLQNESSEITEFQVPAKLTDAISMGIPVIATPIGPLEEVVRDGKAIPLKEGENLAELLHKVLSNSSPEQMASSESIDYFRKYYSYEKARSDLSPIIQRLIATEKKPDLILEEILERIQLSDSM